MRFLLDQRYNDTEQTGTFDEGSRDQHGRLDLARSFRLTSDGVHSLTTNAANTKAYADYSKSSSDCSDTTSHDFENLSETEKNENDSFSGGRGRRRVRGGHG